jgi:hypothetical protein
LGSVAPPPRVTSAQELESQARAGAPPPSTAAVAKAVNAAEKSRARIATG